jgi:hypothetical protein
MVASTPVANGSYLPAFVRSFLDAKTGIQLVEVATQLIREIGFETLIYGSVFANEANDPTIVVATTIPGEWMERYERMHYFNVDPRFQSCLRHVTPFLWDSRKTFAPQASAFLEDAAHHGMRSGITLPLRSPMGENAMFGVESPRNELPDDQRLQLAVGRMYLFASHFHDCFFHNLRKQVIGTDVRPPPASRRELEVLSS